MENKELNNENIESNNTVQTESVNFSQIFNVESEEENNTIPETEKQQEETAPRNIQASYNGEEEVIFTIKEEKEKGPLIPFLLIASLLATVLLLPYISKQVKFNNKQAPTVQQQEPTETEEIIYEFNKSSVRAKIGSLELTNFVKSIEHNEYLLSFTINNTAEKSYDFSKKYYIVMYDGNNIIYRALIHSYDGLGALSATALSIRINQAAYNRAKKFKIEEILPASYPVVKTSNVEGDYNILTCKYQNNTIKYYFLNDELHKISDEYNESSEDNEKYEEHYTLYKDQSKQYKNIDGISSTFIETENDFRMINELDLKNISNAKLSQLRIYRFFKYKESIKTVSFELEAQGYKCG